MHRQEPAMGGKVIPISSRRGNEDHRDGAQGENFSQQRGGFIDRVFNLVQKALQKHEIAEAFDRSLDSCTDSSLPSPDA